MGDFFNFWIDKILPCYVRQQFVARDRFDLISKYLTLLIANDECSATQRHRVDPRQGDQMSLSKVAQNAVQLIFAKIIG
jgi:hypothetical protein